MEVGQCETDQISWMLQRYVLVSEVSNCGFVFVLLKCSYSEIITYSGRILHWIVFHCLNMHLRCQCCNSIYKVKCLLDCRK